MGNANPEYQKTFSETGRLNAEIITNKDLTEAERTALKRRVNKITGRPFYKDVPEGETDG
jgi:F0F1-type ATP synthase delta subunit